MIDDCMCDPIIGKILDEIFLKLTDVLIMSEGKSCELEVEDIQRQVI